MNLLASVAVLFALLQAPPSVPATFTGVYRGMESGRVIIEMGPDQNMRMFVTGSTKFIRDGKKSKASEFHDGDAVTVDAERDLRMNLVALRIEVVPRKAAPKPNTGPPGDAEKPN
jgi:hypothetical protein